MGTIFSTVDEPSWSSRVEFFSYDDSTKNGQFTHDELNNRFLDALGRNETIQNMCRHASPGLSKVGRVNCGSCYNHDFIVFRTKRWWYSFEKSHQCILIQRGDSEIQVKNNIRNTEREICKQQRQYEISQSKSVSVHWLIDQLHKQKELANKYNVVTNNCKHFLNKIEDSLKDKANKNERAKFNKDMVEGWFTEIRKDLKQHEALLMDPSRIFIAGETGFPISGEVGHVLEPTGDSQINEKYNSQITVMAGFNASGDFLTPSIIFPEGVKCLGDPQPAVTVLKSHDGWFNSSNLEDFVHSLKDFVAERKIEMPIILFANGYSRRLKKSGVDFCESNNIILRELLPSALPSLQAADIGLFSAMKPVWREEAKQWKKNNVGLSITSYFPSVFLTTWKQVATLQNAQRGFKKSGLYPFTMPSIDKTKLNPSEATDQLAVVDEKDSLTDTNSANVTDTQGRLSIA